MHLHQFRSQQKYLCRLIEAYGSILGLYMGLSVFCFYKKAENKIIRSKRNYKIFLKNYYCVAKYGKNYGALIIEAQK